MKEQQTKLPVKSLIKRYAPIAVIVLCVIAIATILLVTGLKGREQTKNPDDNVKPEVKPSDNTDDKDDLSQYVQNPDDKPVVKPKKTWCLPVKNYTIGMDYSAAEFTYSETLREWLIHKAIDFIVEENAEVFAVTDGTIESITTTVMEGTTIVIIHDDGIRSVYSSLKAEPPVKINQRVSAGTVIGYASDSGYGEFMQGAHVHFEMSKDKIVVNPRDYLKEI